jgi:hypothetical protein
LLGSGKSVARFWRRLPRRSSKPHGNGVREEAIFVSGIKADSGVQMEIQTNLLPFFGNLWSIVAISRRLRGALRPIVTKRGSRDAMDEEVSRARFLARTNDIFRTAKSCGPDAPGLSLSLREMIPRATVTNKVMDTGESTEQP